MSHEIRESRDERAAAPLTSGLRLVRLAGVDIVLHWSLIIIAALIAFSLGAGVFPAWHPDWSPGLIWAMAALASVLFFASIAVHELAHVLVARTQGVPTDRITLFMFGGMAQTSRHPESPKAEFLIAAVGPLTSLIIGFLATLIGSLMLPSVRSDDPGVMMAAAGPGATLLLWLGPINVLLAVFNMIPGFPLDGGRVLRAILWWWSGDLTRATSWAARVGQLFAWLLIVSGALMSFGFRVPLLGTGFATGLWVILVGWFLNNAARVSAEHVFIREALRHVPVSAVMRSRPETVPPWLSVEALVSQHFMQSDQPAFPVVEDGVLLGVADIQAVRSAPRERWPYLTTADVMTPASGLETTSPGSPALDAFERLARQGGAVLPVIGEDGQLRGLVRGEDIAKWLWVHTATAAP